MVSVTDQRFRFSLRAPRQQWLCKGLSIYRFPAAGQRKKSSNIIKPRHMQLWAADSCGKSNQGSSPSKRQHSTKTQKCPMKHHQDQLRIATDCNDVLALEMDIVCHGCQAFIGFIHLLWMQPSRRDGDLWSCHFLNPGKIQGMFENLGTHSMCIETFLAWPIVKRIGLHLDYFPSKFHQNLKRFSVDVSNYFPNLLQCHAQDSWVGPRKLKHTRFATISLWPSTRCDWSAPITTNIIMGSV